MVSLINSQIVYHCSVSPLNVKEISLDLWMAKVLLVAREQPVLTSRLKDEAVDVWRQFMSKGQVEEAYRFAQTAEQKQFLAGLQADH